MAYNTISQVDLEVVSNAADSTPSHSPSPQPLSQRNGFQQLPPDAAEDLGTDGHLQPARPEGDISVGHLVSMIRSMSSASYDMVDDEDIEDDGDNNNNNNSEEAVVPKSNAPRRAPPPIDTSTAVAGNQQPQSAPVGTSPDDEKSPLRSFISDHPVPLSHPTPGLQSLQGAYLGNVERLEMSAERMSASSDIASEIRRMDLEQKRRSSSASVANSVVASNHNLSTANGLSPTGTHPSLRGSVRSTTRPSSSRLEQVSEYGHENGQEPRQLGLPRVPVITQPPSAMPYGHGQLHAKDHEIERLASAASNDTYQQARMIFSDFDGVHCVPQDKTPGSERQAAFAKPPIAQQPGSYRADKMVYYPAPIPTSLNLPPRLSDKPPPRGGGKRHRFSAALRGHRLSIPGLSERPATARGIETAQTSPVETLDRILNDSANAPPAPAFADRPYTSSGANGSTPVNKPSQDLAEQKKKRSSLGMFRFYKRSATPDRQREPAPAPDHMPETEAEAADGHENTALQGDTPDKEQQQEEDIYVVDHTEEDLRDYSGPPNSLMAELEVRKHELKHRTRAAADTAGMRSTLLQLDAVAQKQSEHRRRQRPVTMWANPSMQNIDDTEDEIPLGFMFPEKPNIPGDTRPFGLLETRQFEEDEPLSKRRARLQEQEQQEQQQQTEQEPVDQEQKRASAIYIPDATDPVSSDSEEETLAQRIKRLRNKNRNSVTSGNNDFAAEVLAEIDHVKDDDGAESEKGETLTELRARLQRNSKPQQSRYARIPRARRSMGNISLMRPTTSTGRPQSYAPGMDHALMHPHHASSHGSRTSVQQMPANYGHPQYAGYPMENNPYGYGMARPATFYGGAAVGMNHMANANATPRYYSNMMAESPAESTQQARIDQWRQSVA